MQTNQTAEGCLGERFVGRRCKLPTPHAGMAGPRRPAACCPHPSRNGCSNTPKPCHLPKKRR
ncbi:MAG: hypothetical protein AAGJ46_05525 [Planctomycetota bacterium]